MKKFFLLSLSSLSLVSASSLSGAILLTNLDIGAFNSGTTIEENTRKAVVFTTGSGSSYDITSVELRLNFISSLTATPLLRIREFGTDFTAPGAEVGSLSIFTPPTTLNTPATYSFTSASTITLAPSTTYWLTVDSTSDEFAWRRTNPNAHPISSETGATVAANPYYISTDDGVNYVSDSTQNAFAINVVPEPATYAMIFGALALCVALSRRRR